MVCSLCLQDILDGEEFVVEDGAIKHENCSSELSSMIDDLEKIYLEDEGERGDI